MKRIRKLLTVAAVALLLVMAVLLVVPLPLSWWLPYTETENAVWYCAAKVYDERPITELDEADAREFAEVLEQTTVRFRGWSEDYMLYPYLQLFQLEAGSGFIFQVKFEKKTFFIPAFSQSNFESFI